MSEFTDPILEQYAVEILESIDPIPFTLEQIEALIATGSIYPSFLRGFLNSSIEIHLQNESEDAETIWGYIKSAISNGAAPAVYQDTLLTLINMPVLSVTTRNEIVNTINDSEDPNLVAALNEAFNSDSVGGLEEALQGVNQAIFIFNAYAPYFDQIIPRFQTNPMLEGLEKAKESIENTIAKLTPSTE